MNTLSKHRSARSGLAAFAWVALAASGCHRSKTYEANVEVTRISPVRKDEQGTALTMDVEVSYVECPGTQIEVIRGGREFAKCIAEKVKVGEKVKVKLEHHYEPEGHYDYDVFEVQGCPRPPDPHDEASYKMVRECADWNVNGVRVGFQCKYQNKTELNRQCPWFRRR
jgi:hypothetical protein